jgi:hypothetical protein
MCSVSEFEYTYFPNALFFGFIPQYAHSVVVWVEIPHCSLASGYQHLERTLPPIRFYVECCEYIVTALIMGTYRVTCIGP